MAEEAAPRWVRDDADVRARVPTRVADAFAYFDYNDSGFLDYRELRNALRHYGVDLSTTAAKEVVLAYDDKPDGKLDLPEFYELVRDLENGIIRHERARPPARRAPPASVPARVSETFRYFDYNDSGFLDYRELRNALRHYGVDVSTAAAKEVVLAYDDRPDGKLDVGEFAQLVRDIETRGGFYTSRAQGRNARSDSPRGGGVRANAPVRMPARRAGANVGDESERAERLLRNLAAGIRKRLYDDLKRPRDLFGAWDKDSDGLVSVRELLAGSQQLGLIVEDERLVERGLLQTFGDRAKISDDEPAIDFAAFAAWLDPHSAYRRKNAGASSAVTANESVQRHVSSAAFGSSAARWGGGGIGDRYSARGAPREGENLPPRDGFDPRHPISDPDSPPAGQLALEIHHFLPCQKLQRDAGIETLQVQTDFLGLCQPPVTTPTAPKAPGKPVLWSTQQLITIARGSEGWSELGQRLASGIPHEAEVGLLVIEPERNLHIGTAVINLIEMLRSGSDIRHTEIPLQAVGLQRTSGSLGSSASRCLPSTRSRMLPPTSGRSRRCAGAAGAFQATSRGEAGAPALVGPSARADACGGRVCVLRLQRQRLPRLPRAAECAAPLRRRSEHDSGKGGRAGVRRQARR